MNKEYLQAVADLLKAHRIISSTTELTKSNFSDLITVFQEKAGLFVDGILGRDTLWKLQYPESTNANRLHWVNCEADIAPNYDGYSSLFLRSDAAEKYNRLREEVLSFGGIITTSGGKRGLHARVNKHRSSKSMHYVGLAFDLSVTSGFFSPDKDPFVIVKNKDKKESYWKVYLRAAGGEELELNATYWKSWKAGKDSKMKVQGKFIDFTSLCIKHGFNPISPRSAYTRAVNKLYLSSEWWHFQANSLLIPDFSQFGIELLKIEGYDYYTLRNIGSIWGNRKVIFDRNWF